MRRLWLFLFVLAVVFVNNTTMAEPPLPVGLEPDKDQPDSEPTLTTGLGDGREGGQAQESIAPDLPLGLVDSPPLPRGLDEPDLPLGLDEVEDTSAVSGWGNQSAFSSWGLSGFWEARAGFRVRQDAHQKNASLAESRLHLEVERTIASTQLNVTADLIYDEIEARHRIGLESGRGWLDLREASFNLPVNQWLDAKLGRQVLTWGVGDLVFLNDLFPKDWNAFLSGRDVEYLKAPSDAVKLAAYSSAFNLDLIYTPRFDADRFIDGRRLSFFNRQLGRVSGRDAMIHTQKPNDWFADDEWALRAYRTVGVWEAALYAYRGYWKSPAGFDASTGAATFPRLRSYGASLRGPAWSGILSSELSWYVSADDRAGDNPLIRNSEFRFLLAYEQEVATDVTLGLQYYLERILDYDQMLVQALADVFLPDRARHVVTSRLTWLSMDQNLSSSLFVFYSPSDRDVYLRPLIQYKASDHWTVEAGANIFTGRDEQTFFAQFETNSNVYGAIRYGF